MIREVDGTIYLTAEAFLDRYHWMAPDAPFTYATGNLSSVSKIDGDARELLRTVHQLESRGVLSLHRKWRSDRKARGGTNFYEYIATRRELRHPRRSERIPETAASE